MTYEKTAVFFGLLRKKVRAAVPPSPECVQARLQERIYGRALCLFCPLLSSQ